MYYRGEGVSQNYAEAMRWFQAAADQGHAVSLYNLGMMYRQGKGTTQDREKKKKKEWG